MNLTDIQYLIAAAQEEHMGRAAKKCNVTQPTLSNAIKKLENRYKINIFERLNNKILLTDEGRLLFKAGQQLMDAFHQFETTATMNCTPLTQPLTIGAIHTVSPYLFPHLIPALNQLAPKLPLIIKDNFTAGLREALLNASLDVAIIALPFCAPGILVKKIYEEPLEVVLPNNHRLTKQKTIAREDLQGEPMLLLGEGHCLRDQILQSCPNCYDTHWQQTVEGISLETIRHMVASGMGITILPKSANISPHYEPILTVRPFASTPPKRDIALAWRASYPRPEVIDILTTALSSCTTEMV